MFLALIAALLAGVVTLRLKNDALESQRGPSTPLGVKGS
jgi:hypothetical protein